MPMLTSKIGKIEFCLIKRLFPLVNGYIVIAKDFLKVPILRTFQGPHADLEGPQIRHSDFLQKFSF